MCYARKYILKPPVTMRLTENVILSKELTPHASVYAGVPLESTLYPTPQL